MPPAKFVFADAQSLARGRKVYVLVNNKAEGSSPLTVTAVLNVVATASPLAEPTGCLARGTRKGSPSVRVSRLLSILLLQGRGQMSAVELAAVLEVSVRTLYRSGWCTRRGSGISSPGTRARCGVGER